MGNSSSSGGKGKDKNIKHGRSVLKQKLQRARAAGQLNLDGQGLKALPGEVMAIANIKVLSVNNNKIKELPEELGAELRNLKRLSVDVNRLEALPDFSGNMKMTHLSATENVISLEGLMGLPPSLEAVHLSRNALGTVPEPLLLLPRLVSLDLTGNNICELPENLGPSWQSLQEFILDDNFLTMLPESMCELRNLKTLSLKRNRIGPKPRDGPQGIPESLLTSTPVQALELEGNPLSKEDLMEFEGVQAFSERRLTLKNKSMAGGAATSFDFCGLDA
eukprot:CAMPEP_0118878170 /NCGR_PEP_ID=MMETSP1163-20130328/18187_1 /TAXON_ID=124430 /ORGANISM="Phaeomonas parva, Strain CCMP2877" /LENGTH=276 /DNA_ID=CAMNT_0006813971 /DNA_START=87 /DNA_END=917 /DNA_ORIENTATION=-